MTAVIADEPARSNDPAAFASAEGTRKLQLKIGGLHCSFCAGTIEQAMDSTRGVHSASVNLAHEEALIEYEPTVVGAEKLKSILLELGYTLRDASRPRSPGSSFGLANRRKANSTCSRSRRSMRSRS